MKPAIIISSHTIGLNVLRSLSSAGVPVVVFYYDKNDMGYVSKYVKEKIYIPHPEDDETTFIDTLLYYGKKYNGAVIFPCDDPSLTTISKNKFILEKKFLVACPGWEIVEKIIDKKYSYELAEKSGIPHPKTYAPQSLEEAKMFGDVVGYPCIVKPRRSHIYFEHLKKKMEKVNKLSELINCYIEATKVGVKILIQEYIPGDDTCGVNYNSYFWKGKPILEFTAEKCRLAQPGFGIPRVVKSKYIPEIIEPGRKILETMGFFGYSCTEFKKDVRDDIYKFMEVNGRHNRSGLLSLRCGINFPLIEYEHLTRGMTTDRRYKYEREVYWIDEFHDVFSSIKYFKKEKYTTKDYLSPYFKKNIFATFDTKDLQPFLKRSFDLFRKALL